jgi:hypothetical protein
MKNKGRLRSCSRLEDLTNAFHGTVDLDLVLKKKSSRHQWLTPVILATQVAEIRRITV